MPAAPLRRSSLPDPAASSCLRYAPQLARRRRLFASPADHQTSTVDHVSSASAPVPAGPPPPRRRQRLRARWADRHALPRFGFWLLRRGAVVLAVCGGLYALNGFLIGWADAYNVMVGITSPADVRPQWCAWPLSLAGWAAIPAVVGAAAGYVITEQIQAHHARELSDVLGELRRLAEPPAPPSGGGS
jgi:hypothetical protein